MKTLLMISLFVFAAPVFAQQQTVTSGGSACGPMSVQFDAKANKSKHNVPQAQAGKALVHVIEVFQKPSNQFADPTIRVGLDGAWVGASRSNTYLSFYVDPGEHHLCTSWQSMLKRLSQNVALAPFTAEAGKSYYFRARVLELENKVFTLELDPLNADQGQYLASTLPPSVSHPKK
jgi:hypothetical protein